MQLPSLTLRGYTGDEMNYKSWLKVYYPKQAKETDAKEAVAHSLQKWHGLDSAVLHRYGMWRDGRVIMTHDEQVNAPRTVHSVNAHNCALCVHYADESIDLNYVPYEYGDECRACPLYQYLGSSCYDGEKSPYHAFIRNGDTGPMIEALTAVADFERVHDN